MPGARSLLAFVSASLLALSACATIAPAVETVAPANPAASGISGAPTDSVGAEPSTQVEVPSLEVPTIAPETEEPATSGPTQEPEPIATETPPKTKPPQPEDRPNLVISEFVVDEDPVLVGTTSTLTATVMNTGSADAGPFIVEIVLIRADQSELVWESKPFENGLAAGDSTELTTTIDPNDAGGLRFIARADVIDGVSESDESDNERVLDIMVQSLGNLAFLPDGFTVAPSTETLRYTFDISLTNTGSSIVEGSSFSVLFFGSPDGGNTTVNWGTIDFGDISLAPGGLYERLLDFPVDPGTYRAYALADSGETLAETDESDNEAFYDFTAP